MNGKSVTTLAALLLTGCTQQPPAVTVQAPANVSPAKEIGRYQLLQGEYEFMNIKGEGSWSKALFKLDTLTGDLFVCNAVQAWIDDQPKQITACHPFESTHVLVHVKPKS